MATPRALLLPSLLLARLLTHLPRPLPLSQLAQLAPESQLLHQLPLLVPVFQLPLAPAPTLLLRSSPALLAASRSAVSLLVLVLSLLSSCKRNVLQ